MVVGILAIVLFLVSLGLSYKSWRVHTLILAFLVFAAAGTQFVMAVYALKTHKSWQEIIYGVRKPDREKRSNGLVKDIEIETRKNEILAHGDWTGGVLTTEGIDQKKQRLLALSVDRGGCWKQCIPAPQGDDGRVNVRVPNPEGRQLRANMLVYAFEDTPVADGGKYVGEFRITGVTVADEDDAAEEGEGGSFTTIQLVPSLPLDPTINKEEIERITQSVTRLEGQGEDAEQGHWTIYDRMPADAHYLFSAQALEKDGEELSSWVPESVLEEYKKDLQPADKNDPAERVEVLVRFRKDYEYTVPELSGELVAPTGDDEDDEEEAPTEFTVSFKKGQVAWLPKKTAQVLDREVKGADDLAAEEIVQIKTQVPSNFDSGIKLPGYPAPESDKDFKNIPVAPRYVRELRNYRTLFRGIRGNQVRQREAAEKLAAQTAQLDVDLSADTATLEALNETTARLESDSDNHAKEEKAAKNHLSDLNTQLKKLAAERKKLLQDNDRLAAELDRLQKRAARVIDQRAPAPSIDGAASLLQPAGDR